MNQSYQISDCVQMKWEIQQQLAKEFAGVPKEEAQRILTERVMANPIFGALLKQARRTPLPYRPRF